MNQNTSDLVQRTGKALLWLMIAEIAYGLVVAVLSLVMVLCDKTVDTVIEVGAVRVFQISFLLNSVGAIFSLLLFLRRQDAEAASFGKLFPHLLNWIYVVCLAWVFGASLMLFGRGGFVD